jgi:hypothetical protein
VGVIERIRDGRWVTEDLAKKEMIFYSPVYSCFSLDTSLCTALATESSVLTMAHPATYSMGTGDKVVGA